MNTSVVLVSFFFAWWCQIALCQNPKFVQQDKAFPSPDAKFVAQLTVAPVSEVYPKEYHLDPADPTDCLRLTRKSTKAITLFEQSPTVYSLQWTGDSKTLVEVEVIAHGSDCELYHYAVDKWERKTIHPPGNPLGDYSVVKCDVGFDTIQITYKVFQRPPVVSRAINYVITFVIDAATGAIKHADKNKEISNAEYERLDYK